jgi:hypothetical protein
MKPISLAVFAVFVFSVFSCNEVENNNTEQVRHDTTIVKQEQTEADGYIKAGKEGVGLVKDMVENKKRKDSIRNENKEPFWVYQIGDAYASEDLACKEFEILSGIPNIKIFKRARHEYYLVKDDGLSNREDYEETFGEVKKSIQALSALRVKIIDLSHEYCSSKTKPTTDKPIRYKVNGEKIPVSCLVCD